MKTLVHVLVPYSTVPELIWSHADKLLSAHKFSDGDPEINGRFDYLCGIEPTLNDLPTEQRLPHKVRQQLSGIICEVERLPDSASAAALVTPDGDWHDISDFGWCMIQPNPQVNERAEQRWDSHYWKLIRSNPDCWVVETYAHS